MNAASNVLSELLDRAASGNLSAYGEFVDRSSPAAFRLALVLSADSEAADSLLCRCYIEAWKHVSEFRGSGRSPLTWLLVRLRSG